MNNEEQRIAIAQACGWTCVRPCEMRQIDGEMKVVGIWGESPAPCATMPWVPDYLTDLNAMHEAVNHACETGGFTFQERYVRELRAVVTRRRRDCNEMQIDYWMAEATAGQRAEAFLRTLNLWTE